MKRPSAQDFALLRTFSSGQVSDAMETLDLPRTVIDLPLSSQHAAPMVGCAVTVRQVPKRASAPRSARLVQHGRVVTDIAQADDVVVVAAGGHKASATWGENHSRRCQERGVAGALIDGCTRDSAAIHATNFSIAFRGTSPVKSQWDLETAAINEAVTIDGVDIRPGDVVFSDADGTIVIPIEHVDAVLKGAIAVQNRERSTRSEPTA